MSKFYYDKNATRIEEGMTLQHNDGSIATVYKCQCMGVETLGFKSADVKHIHGQIGLSYSDESAFMSLADFNLREWRVISEKDE